MKAPEIARRGRMRCSFAGCAAASATPMREGWRVFADWFGLKDGLYCPAHAEAIEGIAQEGDWPDPGDRDG